LTCFLFFLGGSGSAEADLMQPQRWPRQGPWFEGWYIRVTDPAESRSFAIISTTATHEQRPIRGRPLNSTGVVLPGYQALMLATPEQLTPVIIENFPSETRLKAERLNQNFQWSTASGSSLTRDRADLRFVDESGQEEARVEFTMEDPIPWDPSGRGWGPASWGNLLSGWLPLHWYVHSLGSRVGYRIERLGKAVLEGRGYAHVEKNWGSVFPEKWIWIQATRADNKAHLALAGGPLNWGPLDLSGFLVGLRSLGGDFDFNPSQIGFGQAETIDACAGRFELEIWNARKAMSVRATAPPNSFGPLAIPTVRGYERDGAHQSFLATVEVAARDRWSGEVLAQETFSQSAALEFGGLHRCSARP
jgi:hypothetical protein